MPHGTSSSMPLSELVVLGLIAEHPRHGYNLEREIIARRLRSWTPLGRSLIYNVLARLRQRALVSSRQKSSVRGPGAEECRITPKGRRELRRAISAAIAEDLRDPCRLEVAIMLGWLLGPQALKDCLIRRQAKAREELQASRTRRTALHRFHTSTGADPFAATREAIFDHFELLIRAEIAWCKRALERTGWQEPAAASWRGQ